MSTYLLKSIDEQVSAPISILINKSLETGVFPDSLKLAKVIPIYKAKARKNFKLQTHIVTAFYIQIASENSTQKVIFFS